MHNLSIKMVFFIPALGKGEKWRREPEKGRVKLIDYPLHGAEGRGGGARGGRGRVNRPQQKFSFMDL